ncbi:MAG: DUF885 family protein [Myxococcota bacterium]|nr:DUF885 family protein [Myxococcota bacterium]
MKIQKKIGFMALLGLVSLAVPSCHMLSRPKPSSDEIPKAVSEKAASFLKETIDAYVGDTLYTYPHLATKVGYDIHRLPRGGKIDLGRELPNFCEEVMTARVDKLKSYLKDLEENVPAKALSPRNQADNALLRDSIRQELFQLTVLEAPSTNILFHVSALAEAIYYPLLGTYASRTDQLGDLFGRLQWVPAFVDRTIRVVKSSAEIYDGPAAEINRWTIGLIEKEMPKRIGTDKALSKQYADLKGPVLVAMNKFQKFIENELPRMPKRSWQLGRAKYDRYFKYVFHAQVTPDAAKKRAKKRIETIEREIYALTKPLYCERNEEDRETCGPTKAEIEAAKRAEEERKAALERKRAEEERQKKEAEEKKRAAEERKRIAAEKKQAAEDRRKAALEQKRAAAEERKRRADEKKRAAEERKKAALEKKRAAAEERKRRADEKKRAAEERAEKPAVGPASGASTEPDDDVDEAAHTLSKEQKALENAMKALKEAQRALANAEKAKAEARQAKIEASKAKIEAEKAKIEASKAKIEAEKQKLKKATEKKKKKKKASKKKKVTRFYPPVYDADQNGKLTRADAYPRIAFFAVPERKAQHAYKPDVPGQHPLPGTLALLQKDEEQRATGGSESGSEPKKEEEISDASLTRVLDFAYRQLYKKKNKSSEVLARLKAEMDRIRPSDASGTVITASTATAPRVKPMPVYLSAVGHDIWLEPQPIYNTSEGADVLYVFQGDKVHPGVQLSDPQLGFTAAAFASPGRLEIYGYGSKIKPASRRALRLVFGDMAFRAGWGIYAAGAYAKKVQGQDGWLLQIAALAAELKAAVAFMADMGLHTGALTESEATDLLARQARVGKNAARRIIARMRLFPVQSAASFVGLVNWHRISKKQSNQYDFHKEALSIGPVPMPVLQKMVTEK